MASLSDYLTDTGTKQADFASRVGATQATISRLANKTLRPGLDLALAIERETDGKVPASMWASVPTSAPPAPLPADAAP